jgi:hypothetical protein
MTTTFKLNNDSLFNNLTVSVGTKQIAGADLFFSKWSFKCCGNNYLNIAFAATGSHQYFRHSSSIEHKQLQHHCQQDVIGLEQFNMIDPAGGRNNGGYL